MTGVHIYYPSGSRNNQQSKLTNNQPATESCRGEPTPLSTPDSVAASVLSVYAQPELSPSTRASGPSARRVPADLEPRNDQTIYNCRWLPMSYENELDRMEKRFVHELGRSSVDRYEDRIVVDYDGQIVQITGKNRCIVGASRRNRKELRWMVKEALEPHTGREDAFPSVAKQQMEGYHRCTSCGKLKDSPEDFGIVEQTDRQTVRLCWGCHERGRSL